MILLTRPGAPVRDGVNDENVGGLFKAEKFQLKLTERDSTATLTIGPDAPEILVGDILTDQKDPGAGIVWRVKGVKSDYTNKTRTVTCEHAINSLKDFIAFGEITPKVITGNPSAQECTNLAVMQWIMGKQYPEQGIGGETPILWRFGSVTGLVSAAYSFNSDDLFSMAETVSSTMHNPWWRYDFGQFPYVLSITEPPDDAVCELRLSRNMQSLQISEDRSRMYTRFFPIGAEDLRLSEGCVQKNQTLYGIIDHTETNDNMTTEADLRKWATEELNKNCEPILTITVNARDLSGITGEDLDRLQLGASCRVVLPDEGRTITQRVVSLSWNDKENDPTNVQIQLANVKEEATTIIKRQAKKSSSGGRSKAASNSKALKDVILTGPTNNQYTLTKKLANGKEEPIGTFSRAVTGWNVAVSADTLRVTAKPQEQTKVVPLRMGTITRTGYHYRGYVQFSPNDRATWTNTNIQVDIDASDLYNAGRNETRIQRISWGAEELSPDVTFVANTDAPKPKTRTVDMNVYLSGTTVYVKEKDREYPYWTNRMKLDVSEVKNLVSIQLFSWGSEELSEDVTVVANTNAPVPQTRTVDMNVYLSGTTVYVKAKDRQLSSWTNRMKLDVSSVKNLVTITTPGWGSEELSEDVNCTVTTNAPSPASKVINMNLYQSGNVIYMKARYDGAGNWTNRLKITPTLNWTMPSALSTSSTEPSGSFDYSYAVSKGYSWAYWTMTVNGVSKKVKIHLI